MSYQQTFKNIDDILRKDAGASSELDYTEQTSWILFLKYLDDLEKRKAIEAELKGEIYTCLLYTSPSPRDATLSRMPSSA